MRHPIFRTFVWITMLMLVVSMACSLSGGSPTSTPPGSPTDTPSAPPTTSAGSPVPTSPAGATAGGGCANAYFPVKSGDSWSYASKTTAVDGSSLRDYTYTATVTAVSDKGFSTSSQASTGTDVTVNWNCQDGNLAELDTGATTTSAAKVPVTVNSVSAQGYNIPAAFDAGVTWSETITANTTAQISATQSVNSQFVSTLNCTAAGAEKIALPVGSFDTVKATCTKTVVVSATLKGRSEPPITIQEAITDWYAKNVGLVKSVAVISSVGSNNKTTPTGTQTVVLTQYKVQ